MIDDILIPLTSLSPKAELNNPDAFQFLQTADSLDIGDHRVRWELKRKKKKTWKILKINSEFFVLDLIVSVLWATKKKVTIRRMVSTHSSFQSKTVLRYEQTMHFNHVHSKRNDNHFVFHLQPHPRPEMIDRKVIDGHVIPNKVIFTAAAPIEQPFNTLAFEDNVKVTITFFTQGEGKTQKSNWNAMNETSDNVKIF